MRYFKTIKTNITPVSEFDGKRNSGLFEVWYGQSLDLDDCQYQYGIVDIEARPHPSGPCEEEYCICFGWIWYKRDQLTLDQLIDEWLFEQPNAKLLNW